MADNRRKYGKTGDAFSGRDRTDAAGSSRERRSSRNKDRSAAGSREERFSRAENGRRSAEDRPGRAENGRRFAEDRFGRAENGRRFAEDRPGRAENGRRSADRLPGYAANEGKLPDERFAADGETGFESGLLEGRNVILEAYRSGRTIERLLIQDGCQDGPIQSIRREARRQDTIIDYVSKERLDHISQTGKHQGVIAYAAAYAYSSVEDMLSAARAKGEDPFLFLLDDIEDPHNLGAIIRTANLAGAHGVIIPKRHAAGLTAAAARASAGAVNYTPVARVTNLGQTIEELKKEGLWFACADMGGDVLYTLNLTGPLGIVVGNEGDGVGRLLKEKCDYIARIPTKGDIDSLNASVAAGVLAFEVVRQRGGFR